MTIPLPSPIVGGVTNIPVRVPLAIAVVLFAVLGYFGPGNPSYSGVGLAAVVGLSLILAIPDLLSWSYVIPAAAVGVSVCLIGTATPENIVWFTLCVLTGWAIFVCDLWLGAAFTLYALGLIVVQWVVIGHDASWSVWLAGVIFTAMVCMMGKRQMQLADTLRMMQAELAHQARLEERNRIAQEVHDVIGHTLTVSLLHISSARLAVEEDPNSAIESLREAERLGRNCLTEVRRTVGMLHTARDAPLPPAPHATDLAELIDDVRRAGTQVDSNISGDPSTIGSTEGLAVYRIVQEALTNVVRHAPDSHTTIDVHFDSDMTRLRIRSNGPPGSASATGQGLISMRERAAVLGGTLTAGPADSGWVVEAELPR